MNKKDYYWAKYMLIFGFFCICFRHFHFPENRTRPRRGDADADSGIHRLTPRIAERHGGSGAPPAVGILLCAVSVSDRDSSAPCLWPLHRCLTKSAAALLTAARLTSVLSGTGTLIVVFLIGEELFERRESALLGGIFVGFPAAVRVPLLLCKQRFFCCFHGRTDHLLLDPRHEKRILQERLHRPWSRLRTLRAVVLQRLRVPAVQHSAVLRADDAFQETGKGDLRQSASDLRYRLPDRRLVLHPQCRHPRRRPARHAHHKGIRIAVRH